jgi:hypothetical protein
MPEIYLSYHGPAVHISEEAFQRILDIINECKVCSTCHRSYDPENPCIALNTCLQCFLQQPSHRGFRFLGIGGQNCKQESYHLLDPHSYIIATGPSQEEPRVSITATLRHWQFPVPNECQNDDGASFVLQDYADYWRIYGELSGNALVVRYKDGLGRKVTLLLYKDGVIKPLNRRKKEIRHLFTLAYQKAEASRDAAGYYHLFGVRTVQLTDPQLYRLIAEVASEQ